MAERHFVSGGVNNNWGTTGNWSLTEGGAGGQSVPTATEDVFFDAGSPDCVINAAERACLTLTATEYTHTLTFTYRLNVHGNITIGSGMQFAGTSVLAMVDPGTITCNGNTIGVPLTLNFISGTCTLADDLTVGADLQLTNQTSTTFAGDFHITAATCGIGQTQTVTIVHDVTITGLTTCTTSNVINGLYNWNTGGLTMAGGSATLTGTTTIVLTGGTVTTPATTYVSNPLVINGDVTFSGTCFVRSPTITWTSGTISAGAGILSHGAAACTWDTEGGTFPNVSITAASTHTLNSLLSVAGSLNLPNASVVFDGTDGWTVETLSNDAPNAARTLTLAAGKTYTMTAAMNLRGASTANKWSLVSGTPGTKVMLTLGYGATQSANFVYPTDMDSSLGQAIYTHTGTIATSYNWSNLLGYGGIIPDVGGESVAVAGITKDNSGSVLGSCDVYLFRDNGNDTATFIAYVESNSVTGAYSFTVFPGSTYFVVAFKGGATPVMDVTDRTVTAV